MSDDLVERVARAIDVAQSDWWASVEGPKMGLADTSARAAIAAMREPTEAMIDAGAIYADHNGAHGAWQAMIDCALKEDA